MALEYSASLPFNEPLPEDPTSSSAWEKPEFGVSSILSEQRAQYGDRQNFDDVWEPFHSASPEVQDIIKRVLKVESRRLSRRNHRGVTSEIIKIVQNAIPE